VASDNIGEQNGLFTKHLLNELKTPMGVAEMFRRVRKDVFDASKGAQLPYLHDQMIADMALNSTASPTVAEGAPAQVPAPRNTAASPSQDFSGQFEQGKELYHQGQCQQAASTFGNLVRRDPENAFVHNALGLAYMCLNLYKPAAESFRMAIELKPDFAAPYLNRGQVYLNLGSFELANQDFTWAIEQEPENAAFYSRRGRALFGLRRYEDAISDFTRGVELDPGDPNSYHGRGKVLHQLGKYREALADYDDAIRRKRDAAYYADRALTRDRLGDSAGAASDRAAASATKARNN
jgi:tetratricopeptide (TPR) repeat protein